MAHVGVPLKARKLVVSISPGLDPTDRRCCDDVAVFGGVLFEDCFLGWFSCHGFT